MQHRNAEMENAKRGILMNDFKRFAFEIGKNYLSERQMSGHQANALAL